MLLFFFASEPLTWQKTVLSSKFFEILIGFENKLFPNILYNFAENNMHIWQGKHEPIPVGKSLKFSLHRKFLRFILLNTFKLVQALKQFFSWCSSGFSWLSAVVANFVWKGLNSYFAIPTISSRIIKSHLWIRIFCVSVHLKYTPKGALPKVDKFDRENKPFRIFFQSDNSNTFFKILVAFKTLKY